MTRLANLCVLGLVVVWTAGSLGCSKTEVADNAPAADTGMDAAPADVAASEIEKALANLSAADRALVDAQKDCPVSGEPLGSMGAPIEITKEGKSLFVCCDGCKDQADAKFAEFIAKIDEAKATAAASN